MSLRNTLVGVLEQLVDSGVIKEDEALIVRKMFQMYTFGKEGSSAICKQLNEAGNRNRNGHIDCKRDRRWRWRARGHRAGTRGRKRRRCGP